MSADDFQHHYIPLTAQDEARMLADLGRASIDELFEVIPGTIRDAARFEKTPAMLSEYALTRTLEAMARKNQDADALVSFLGGGIYDHFSPRAVRHLLLRSEFYTAYTPYQPEVSQGTLQIIFEFQSLLCSLTGTRIANASHYDGATALAEGALMAIRASKKWEVLVSSAVNPRHRAVLETYLTAAGARMSLLDTDASGRTTRPPQSLTEDAAAVVLGYPNYLGVIEDIAGFRAAYPDTHLVVDANPLALALYRSPGEMGADIVVGDAQSIGVPQSFGGPGLGYMAVTEKLMRQLPGRIVGKTVDADGKEAFVLTLQAREQHIRRHRASSNICTNQALMATATTIHLTMLGKRGLSQVARNSYHNAHYLVDQLESRLGLERLHTGPFFHEFAVDLKTPARPVIESMREAGYLAGVGLHSNPDSSYLLIATTEKRTKDEMDGFVQALGRHLDRG